MAVTYLEISYPNFALGAIIDPEEANQNNYEIVTKINDSITNINKNEDKITNILKDKADITYVDNKFNNLAGENRTNQTIKGNYDNLINHKSSSDHDTRYYTRLDIDNKIKSLNEKDTGIINLINVHKKSNDHDSRYYTKDELTPWLRGGDTYIHEDVYVITNPNNGDGTFSYNINGTNVNSELTDEGYQVFHLVSGSYSLGMNRLEVIINDTLRRSVASGGIIELDEQSIALTNNESAGAEVTIKYYERIGMTAEYNIKLSKEKPPNNDGKNMWFEILEK